MYLKNYLEQHNNIKEELQILKNLVNRGNIEGDAQEISLHINTLAGKIKVHLASEDKHMYLDLINSGNEEQKKTAIRYQNEMGDLMDVFTTFKGKYNTRSKILENHNSFRQELRDIITAIEKRIAMEESGLYQLLE